MRDIVFDFRVGDIDEVMRNALRVKGQCIILTRSFDTLRMPRSFVARHFAGADIHPAIDLAAVGGYDLTVKLSRESDSQGGLA
jgi:hypothetical protein